MTGLFKKSKHLRSAGIFLYRAKTGFRYPNKSISAYVKWLLNSKETTNFTYDLSPLNRRYLINFIAGITNCSYQQIETYVKEIETDEELKNHIKSTIINGGFDYKSDAQIKFSRRIGWYAFIRVLKPQVVIETGIDKGMGSCVIASALMKNSQEGHTGRYYGTDINPRAGFLFTKPYSDYGELLIGDSIESLKKLDVKIDLFINDSDHSSSYEGREYETIQAKLSDNAILLGDNSHESSELLDFALRTNRNFQFFKEQPHQHIYHGAGIGCAYKS